MYYPLFTRGTHFKNISLSAYVSGSKYMIKSDTITESEVYHLP